MNTSPGKFGTTKSMNYNTERHYKSFYMRNDLTKEIHCKKSIVSGQELMQELLRD